MLEIRRRVNVKKLTKGEWTFDCTVEVGGSESEWRERAVMNAYLAAMIADTCDTAAGEIERQITGPAPE